MSIRANCIIIFVLISFVLNAQSDSLESYSKLVFSVSGSHVVPRGKCAEYGSNGISGIPFAGIGGKVECDYFISRYFGFTCSYFVSNNTTNSPTKNQLFPTYPGGGLGGGYTVT